MMRKIHDYIKAIMIHVIIYKQKIVTNARLYLTEWIPHCICFGDTERHCFCTCFGAFKVQQRKQLRSVAFSLLTLAIILLNSFGSNNVIELLPNLMCASQKHIPENNVITSIFTVTEYSFHFIAKSIKLQHTSYSNLPFSDMKQQPNVF